MSIVDDVLQELPLSLIRTGGTGSPTFIPQSLSASGDKTSGIFQIRKTGNVTTLECLVGAVTTPGNFDFRLETVDGTTGAPSGTLVNAGANAVIAVSGSGWVSVTLATPGAVTKGQLVAFVIARSTGSVAFQRWQVASPVGFPYIATNVTGTYVKGNGTLCCALGYDDGSYPFHPGIFPIKTITTIAYNLNTVANDEVGNVFTIPVTRRVTGAWLYFLLGGDADIVLYDSSNTILLTLSFDKDDYAANDTRFFYLLFPTRVNLTPGASYRLVVKPTTTTNVTVITLDANTSALMTAMPGGANWTLTARVDAGAWTDTNTRWALMGLLTDGLDNGISPNRIFGVD